jgi:hypothetical protein
MISSSNPRELSVKSNELTGICTGSDSRLNEPDYELIPVDVGSQRLNLRVLKALPGGMASSMQRGPRSRTLRKQKRKLGLAVEGQAISTMFNIVASRPIPHFVSLDQSIRVTTSQSLSSWVSTSAIPSFASVAIVLSSFADNGYYLNVFDQYRIDQVEVWLEPAAPSTAQFGLVATCVDLDDANLPTSYSQVQAHQDSTSGLGGNGRYHRWKPHIALASFCGAFTCYSNLPSQWIDSASPSVQHYGFKVALASTVAVISYDLTLRIVVSFRCPGIA